MESRRAGGVHKRLGGKNGWRRRVRDASLQEGN